MYRTALVLLFLLGCSSPDTTPFGNSSSAGADKVCAPGHQVSCACPGGVQSVQVCTEDGTGYGACECGNAGAGGMGGMSLSATASSTAASGGMGGMPAVSCAKQSDCDIFKDACHVGDCINSACEKNDAPNGTVCDDAQACTVGDHCVTGSCVSGAPMVCPVPADACHVAFCDPAKQACTIAPGNDGAACDDGNPCTTDGTCTAGNCVNAPPISCSQLDTACTMGVCDQVVGCVAKPKSDGTACDDMKGNPCTTGSCSSGQCASIPANEGQACNDGLFCTDPDLCAGGVCSGKPKVCPAPGDVCMAASCDEASQSCGGKPGNNGTFCDDNNVCTTGEKCSAGTCGGGQPANGVSCNDGNACTANDTCGNGGCAGTPIVQCISGDGCCPNGCSLQNDTDCLWWVSGIQQNVPEATLTGWTQCYDDTYDKVLQGELPTIQSQCSKAKMLLACRPVGSPTWNLAAMGLKTDVMFDCGSDPTCTHQANGVGWYYGSSWSWGFANANDPVNRNECDVTPGPLRLCWHTVAGSGGYRCGDAAGLNSDATWERAIYHAD